jgi:hypothetical protein
MIGIGGPRGPEGRDYGYHIESGVEIEQHQVEGITEGILENEEVLRFVVNLIQQKISIKDELASLGEDDGSNEYAKLKRLGMFVVEHITLPDELMEILANNGVELDNNQVLELHIPPQTTDFGDFENSLDRIRQYIKANEQLDPQLIFGISYLAKYASRYGFTVLDLPQRLKEESGAAQVLKKYQEETGRSLADDLSRVKDRIGEKFNIEDIKLCYLDTADLCN